MPEPGSVESCQGAVDAKSKAVSSVAWPEAFRVWVRVALLSFGGPAAQIAVMHRIVVDEKKWVDEKRFLNSLNFCMLLPGPEAQQLATYLGWLLHGVRGGLMAGILFVLPGFFSILLLSYAYVSFSHSTHFESFFFGLKCAVLAVVAEALIRVAKRALHRRTLIFISACSFCLLLFNMLPFPAVIGLAALAGIAGHRLAPGHFQKVTKPQSSESVETKVYLAPFQHPSFRNSALVLLTCLMLWFAPIVAMSRMFGRDSVFVESSVFFSKAAVVTFGGAYSVLSYVDQQAVEKYHWVEKGEMLDGLGLAETTPGPLIMVVQFVGFLAAFKHGEGLSPFMAGTVGACLTTWVTFVPCFLWIFLCAPYMERLLEKKWLASSLTAITAAVVGVIATLGVNMLVATLFQSTVPTRLGIGFLKLPVWSTIQFDSVAVTTLAVVLLLILHRSLALTLGACVVVGYALRTLI
jgi:chromate transporter